MSYRDIIVIGASAGGLEAIRKLIKELPADFDKDWQRMPV